MKTFVLFLALSFCVASVAHAKLYRWIDKDGNVHFSDKLPPSSAGQAHQELNEKGDRVVKTVERAKTDKEREIERKVKEAQEKLNKERAEKIKERQLRDKVLMDTFTVEKDLQLLREKRLEAIDSNITITKTYNDRLQEKLVSIESRKTRFTKRNKPIPQNITDEMNSTQQQIRSNLEYVFRMEKEKQEVNARFVEDLTRFRELKKTKTKDTKSNFDGIDLAQIRKLKNIPEPKGDYFGYPIFPGKEVTNEQQVTKIMPNKQNKKDVRIFVAKTNLDTVRDFFVFSVKMLSCEKRETTYICPSQSSTAGISIAYQYDENAKSASIIYAVIN